MAAIKVKGQICVFVIAFFFIEAKAQIWNGPIAKIYRHGVCSPSMQNFMLLTLNEQLFQPNYVYPMLV